MSETITDPVIEPVATPAIEPTDPVTETPAPETPTEPAAEPPPKPDKIERRIANLTRKMADEARAREAAERRAEAAEALVAAANPDKPGADKPATDVEARAAQIVAQRAFEQRLTAIDHAGKKEVGAEAWEQAKDTLTSLGATRNQAFLQALAETDNPAKIFAAMADDTDTLLELLGKTPAALAARLGRMDAEFSKPVARPLSAAPTPPTKLRSSGVVPEANPYNYPPGMSMKEWSKMMDNVLPPSLGGKRKAG